MDATELLGDYKIVPVIVLAEAQDAVPLARTLLEAGMSIMEITLRSSAALASIEQIARDVPEMLVGAGSLRHPEQFSSVANAGAKFAVSPGSTPALCEMAANLKLPFLPGAATVSEALKLLAQGYRLQKFFPAEQAGGTAFLKSIGGPLPEVSFIPTGGIGPERAPDYLALENVSGVGGSWITPGKLLAAGDFAAIGKLAEAAIKAPGVDSGVQPS
jgi:2-dehydro-3-deoxyphosphogluconate aldolase/(4S)-4-hydroxy-2-oxoglutarate aldolase